MATKGLRQRPDDDDRAALLARLDAVFAADRQRRLSIVTRDGTDPTAWRAAMEAEDIRRLRRLGSLSAEQLREELHERELALSAAEVVDAHAGGIYRAQRAAGIERKAKQEKNKRDHMVNAVSKACDIVSGLVHGDVGSTRTPARLAAQIMPRPRSARWRQQSEEQLLDAQANFGSFTVTYRALRAVWHHIEAVRNSPAIWRTTGEPYQRAARWLADAGLIDE